MTKLLFGLALLAVFVSGTSMLLGDDGTATDILLKAIGELSKTDPYDRALKKSYSKVHDFQMKADRAYKIDVRSGEFDTFLRLEKQNGQQVAFNDDISQRNHNSRLIYQAPADGVYRIIITSARPGQTGNYTLTVTPATKEEVFEFRAANFLTLAPKEQSEILAKLRNRLDAKGHVLTENEAGLSLKMLLTLEHVRSPSAPALYREFAKRFAASDNPQIAEVADTLDAAARRLELMGKPLEIAGTLLDGKKIDWAKYKGKVVLVYFWATWCVPCQDEMPAISKIYADYHVRGFDIVGVSLDAKKEKLATFMEKQKIPWPCIFEKDVKRQPLAKLYGVIGIPQSFLVDREGRVVSMNPREQELRSQIEKRLRPEKK